MADHFYAILPGNVESAESDEQKLITVGTSTAGSTYIEVRIPDGLAGANSGRADLRERLKLAMEAFREYFEHHTLPLGG